MGNYTKEDIAKAIKQYRIDHSLTQQQLAFKLNVPVIQIARWENQKTMPRGLSLHALEGLKIIP